jgi:hypothetical protein
VLFDETWDELSGSRAMWRRLAVAGAVINCPYGFSKTLTEFLTGRCKTNSHGSAKVEFFSPWVQGVLPLRRVSPVSFLTDHFIQAGGSLTDRGKSPVDQGARGVAVVGIHHIPPITRRLLASSLAILPIK